MLCLVFGICNLDFRFFKDNRLFWICCISTIKLHTSFVLKKLPSVVPYACFKTFAVGLEIVFRRIFNILQKWMQEVDCNEDDCQWINMSGDIEIDSWNVTGVSIVLRWARSSWFVISSGWSIWLSFLMTHFRSSWLCKLATGEWKRDLSSKNTT